MKLEFQILYGSTTGNTENMIEFVSDICSQHDIKCESSNVADNYKVNINKSSNLLILSCSTWGIEPPVLQEDFEIFWSNLEKSQLQSCKVMILGLGDKYYPHFCYAVDYLTAEVLKHGGEVVNTLKIPDDWEESKADIQETLTLTLKKNFHIIE